MSVIHYDSPDSDDLRRNGLYRGEFYVFSPQSSVAQFCEFARGLIEEYFYPLDPLKLHENLTVEKCVETLNNLKPHFIHHPRSKTLIQGILSEMGCDLEKTYFDVPRLRTAFPGDYLKSGIAYAFHPHRDTWYSAPMCQLNWWTPVFEITGENCMAFHPQYFSRPIRNSSNSYTYQEWNRSNRFSAAQHVKADTRVQPSSEEDLCINPDLRIVTPVGGTILFSGAQLHSTVPNTTNSVRFSIDFRTVHEDDVWARRGAVNVDAFCTGTPMTDYLRGTDLSHFPEQAITLYSGGTPVTPQPASSRE
jgi:hypothetical protein